MVTINDGRKKRRKGKIEGNKEKLGDLFEETNTYPEKMEYQIDLTNLKRK